MPRERLEEKKKRAIGVIDRLDRQMPEAKIELDYQTPLQLLIAVVLSAQSTDKGVNRATPALFQRFPTAGSLAKARPEDVEPLIKTVGLYRTKARNLIAAAKVLVERHGGEVPTMREQLEALPGVGKKSAGVIGIHLGHDLAFPVDTHVGRLARRLGFSTEQDPDKVELDLRRLLPSDRWAKGHQLLVWHGRRTCFARSPACERCVVNDRCPKRGLGPTKARLPLRKTRRALP